MERMTISFCLFVFPPVMRVLVFFLIKKKSEMHTKNIARGKTSHIKKVNCFPNKFYYQTFN